MIHCSEQNGCFPTSGFNSYLFLLSILNSAYVHLCFLGWPLEEISKSLRNHLLSWQHLASHFEQRNQRLFKLRPKHHSLDHLASQVSKLRINPRKSMCCFTDESFLGFLKKIAIRTHASSVLRRVYQRYLIHLSLRWRDASQNWHLGGKRWKKTWAALPAWPKQPCAAGRSVADRRMAVSGRFILRWLHFSL